ncbi:MAG: PAS-domain containing protein [Alphaproteobacteria bacterium]
MEVSLDTALLGVVVALTAQVGATVYARRQVPVPAPLTWWVAGYSLRILGFLGLLFRDRLGDGVGIAVAEAAEVLSGVMVLMGAVVFAGRRASVATAMAGLLAAVLWPVVAPWLGNRLGVSGLPLFGLGAVPMGMAAWMMLEDLRRGRHGGRVLVAVAFALGAIQELTAPVLHASPGLAPWSFVLAQGVAFLTAFAVLVVVFRRQRVATQAESARADRTQMRLSEAIESISEALVLWDAEDRLVTCNGRFRALYADPPIEIRPGLEFPALIREIVRLGYVSVSRDQASEWIEQRMREHRDAVQGVEIEHTNGTSLLLRERKTRDGSVVSILTDITALKQREREIANKSAQLNVILENVPQGVVVFDRDFQLATCNQHTRELLSIPRAQPMTGKTYEALFQHLVGDLASPVESSDGLGIDVGERTLADGRVLEIRHHPMPGGGTVATFTDVTDRKRGEQELREAKEAAERASRAKAAFLAAVSHELRTPLNAIIGFSEAMLGELFGPLENDHYVGYAHDIYESGSHLHDLINDILDMSKAEAGRIDLDERPLDLPRLIAAAIRMIRKRADNARIRIELVLPEALPRLFGDERRLRQVLVNLLSNAVKFTDNGGTIVVMVEADELRGFTLSVSDTGIGIEPEDLDRAVAPFSQIDSGLNRKYEGTGLGLPLTKALVELHGGLLVLESTVGVGTTATVRLPRERIVVELPALGDSDRPFSQ